MTKEMNFEDALESLEKIVDELESGKLPLEDSIKKFEDGIRLSQSCAKRLDEIEKKITVLVKDSDGNLSEKPFEE